MKPGAVDVVCISTYIFTLKHCVTHTLYLFIYIQTGEPVQKRRKIELVQKTKEESNAHERTDLMLCPNDVKPTKVYYYFLVWLWSFKTRIT